MTNFLGSKAFAAALLAVVGTVPAHAIAFNLIDAGGAAQGTNARLGYEIAAAYWSTVLTDNFTVNLQIGYKNLGGSVLGSTQTSQGALLASHAYSALAADSSSSVDAIAVANLKPLIASTTFGGYLGLDAITSAYVDPVNKTGVDTTKTIHDNDGSINDIFLNTTTANLKALGLTQDDQGRNISNVIDGNVTLNSALRFDFTPAGGIAKNSFDFIGVAIHEIGHALGFLSGVDTYDLFGGPLAGPFGAGAYGPKDIGQYVVFTPLDLFRYSPDGLDLSVGADSFFSIDGVNQLFGGSLFSTGMYNGDGGQASHWIDNIYLPRTDPACSNVATAPIGILNPTAGQCEPGFVSGLDLAAFDAIGYNVNNALLNAGYHYSTTQAYLAFVPEPATWALMIGGFGMVGGALRRQRRSGYATA